MTRSTPALVSLVSPWSQARAQFPEKKGGETSKTNETKFLNGPEAGEKNRVGHVAHRKNSPQLKSNCWSQWSHGLTPINWGNLEVTRDQLRPSETNSLAAVWP